MSNLMSFHGIKQMLLYGLCMIVALSWMNGMPYAAADSTFEDDEASLNLTIKPEASTEKSSGIGFYFDTVVSITLYGADDTLLQDIWTLCQREENLLSKTISTSDVARINTSDGEPVTVDPETWSILQSGKAYNAVSGGAFCLTIGALTSIWDFSGNTAVVPSEALRNAAVAKVDDTQLTLEEPNTVVLSPGYSIDLGGIAKGWIANQVAALCENRCLGAAISLGGNVYVTGSKPDGSLWKVAIQDPDNPNTGYAAVLQLTKGSVVTSGVYQRYFYKDGIRYHHILNPETGLPADTGLVSVTVISEDSMICDALATAVMVMGIESGLQLLNDQGLDGLLITADRQMYLTEGFAEKYQLVSYLDND